MSRERGLSLLLALSSAFAGCSSSTGTGPSPSFWSSGATVQPNQVRLAAGSADPDTLTLLVQVVGPTRATDLAGFSFDLLVSDPTVADYIDGSAAAGPALDPAGAGSVTVSVGHAAQRVSITVEGGSASGNGIGPGPATVVALRYRVNRAGTSAVQFAPDPAPAALDPLGAAVRSISFDMVPSAIVGH